MRDKRIRDVFFALLRAGLWEKEVWLLPFGETDYAAILDLAEEQSVVGLLAAGIEHVVDRKPQKEDVLQFIGRTVQFEQTNLAMNQFVDSLFGKMSDAGIYAVLVKGQGIAQCYKRPLWRSCGDVDLLLDAENYRQARSLLVPLAASVDEEDKLRKHLGMSLDSWVVELHGTLQSGLWKRLDKTLDDVQEEVFSAGYVRPWLNGDTKVLLPRADEDVVFVFFHILQHFFKEGIGLRQICDWCRLLWTYRESLDMNLLGKRLKRMDVMSEWKVFAALAVDYLGMATEAMPFYDSSRHWSRKASRVMGFILETGNFGHNRDYSYYKKYPFLVYKTISLWRHMKDGFTYSMIFPLDTIKVTTERVLYGISVALRGK